MRLSTSWDPPPFTKKQLYQIDFPFICKFNEIKYYLFYIINLMTHKGGPNNNGLD